MKPAFDVAVIGGGHAGCEAALAASRIGARVALFTLRIDGIAQMSCNPAIGGVGKGHLVREIDALGGAMARVADRTGIQFRQLNTSRGAAVRSTRCQSDSARYKQAMADLVCNAPNVSVLEDEVADLIVDHGRVAGLVGKKLGQVAVGSIVVTTGTFLNGLCHVGPRQFAGGRAGDEATSALSLALRREGIELRRFKTGTVPRLAAESIQWHRLVPQWGQNPRPYFSFDGLENDLPQVACYVTETNADTHAIIRSNLHKSPLYCGTIVGRGPRYCPSLEDKVVRFADKPKHTVFLEPEGLDSDRVYPNGLSTSLPQDLQEAFLRTIPGLDGCRVLQHGYAVEYDFAPPQQLTPALMTKTVEGLFLAGQINGTSGYEEAAAQGLMAGANAALHVNGAEPAILGRHQAYIGVMIDDLVTKGVDEPYRMFTSRAEHRLTLRESNAEDRLCDIGRNWGLLSESRFEAASLRRSERAAIRRGLAGHATQATRAALRLGIECNGRTLADLLRRPEIAIGQLLGPGFSRAALELVEEEVKYSGYIEREVREIGRLAELEEAALPTANYSCVPGLSRELQEKLGAVQPRTLGQAARIPGMTPAALGLLRVFLARAEHAA